MKDEELKSAIINYVKTYEGGVPSVKEIRLKFGITNKRLYKIFPGKMPELCRLAGKPLPVERMRRTEKAIKSKAKKKKKLSATTEIPSNRLVLSEEQTKRVYGIMHLEKGMDPSLIIDRLLDDDVKARKYKLSLKKRKVVWDFLEAALNIKWKLHSHPNIVDFVTELWNCGVQNLTLETVKGLIGILKDLKRHCWDPKDFVAEATQAYKIVYWFRQYKTRQISAQEFKREVSVLT